MVANLENASEIQLLIVDQIPQISAIHQQCFLKPWNEQSFNELLQAGAQGWVILQEDSPVSFLLLRTLCDETELLTLATFPAYQRQGFAQLLLTKLPDNGRVFLEVRALNSSAIALYQKLNFNVIAKRRDYYDNGDGSFSDALIMQRD